MEKGDLDILLHKVLERNHGHGGLAHMLLLKRSDFIDKMERFLSYLQFDKLEYLGRGDDALVLKSPADNAVIRISTDPKRWQNAKVLRSLATLMQYDLSETLMDNDGRTSNLCITCEILPLGKDPVKPWEAKELQLALQSNGLYWRECREENAVRVGKKAYVSDQRSIVRDEVKGKWLLRAWRIAHRLSPLRDWSREEQEADARALMPRYDEIVKLGHEFNINEQEKEKREDPRYQNIVNGITTVHRDRLRSESQMNERNPDGFGVH